MMWIKTASNATSLWLCFLGALCIVGAENDVCVPSIQTECFNTSDYLDSSGMVRITMLHGKELNINVNGLSGSPVCSWIRGNQTIMTSNKTHFMVMPDSDQYTLTCSGHNMTIFSKTVVLQVLQKRPTKPQLVLTNVNDINRSPRFLCISEDISKPKLEWSKGIEGQIIPGEKAMSKVSTTEYEDKEVMCCATNTQGQECTQEYDYDLNEKEIVPNVTLSPGDSLLLCCKTKNSNNYPAWRKDGEQLNLDSLKCQKDQIKEMCLVNDRHNWHRSYLSIPKISEKHSGTYTCSLNDRNKTFHVQVLAEGFISAQLDERLDVLAEKKSGVCLEAKLSYHPALQLCSWQDPDGNVTKCTETWATKHRTVKFCNLQKSGIYKLFLEAAGKKETKEIKVCVADKPEFKLDRSDNSLTYEVESVPPVNFTWLSCESSNDSCQTNSSWEVVEEGYEKHPEELCVTKIKKSLNGDKAARPLVKFCVTNSLKSWCDQTYGLQMPAPTQASTGFLHPDNGYIMPLIVGIGVLLLALAIVVVSLILVQKKKQQYQPQFQMTEMVAHTEKNNIKFIRN